MMYVTEMLQARSRTLNHTYINPFHGVEVGRLIRHRLNFALQHCFGAKKGVDRHNRRSNIEGAYKDVRD